MTALWLSVYQGFLLIAVLLGIGILYFARSQRGTPGFRPLFILIVGGSVYAVAKLAVSAVRGTPSVFIFTRFNPLGAGLSAVGFCLFAVEYTGIEQPVSRRTAGSLFVFPALVNIAVWLNIEHLWAPAGPSASTVSGYAWDYTGLAVANQVYLNLVVIAGLLVLIWFGLQSAAPFALQTGALLLAGAAPTVGNLLFQIGYVSFNLAPILIVFSACAILWVMIRGQFLDLVPISRDIVIDSVGTGVLTVDADHRVIDINRAARQQFRLREDEDVVGQHIDQTFQDVPAWREAYWSSTDGDVGETLEVEIADRHYEVEATPLTWADGRFRGRSFLIRDVTTRIEREQALQRKNDRLDQFAAMVSHDLISPLHTAQGYLELGREMDEEAHLEKVSQAHGRMESIINELLTLARADEAIDETDLEAIALEPAVIDAWETAETEEARLDADIPPGWTVDAAPALIREILENLFRNAADHNESPVTVTVGTLGSDGFYVEDDGAGIPEPNRDDVFEHGYTTADRGTGFGLSIVQELVNVHGWTISITESAAGGARFEISGPQNTI